LSSVTYCLNSPSIQKAPWHPLEEPVSMQLMGDEPAQMAEAARISEAKGAAIIDINIGLPGAQDRQRQNAARP